MPQDDASETDKRQEQFLSWLWSFNGFDRLPPETTGPKTAERTWELILQAWSPLEEHSVQLSVETKREGIVQAVLVKGDCAYMGRAFDETWAYLFAFYEGAMDGMSSVGIFIPKGPNTDSPNMVPTIQVADLLVTPGQIRKTDFVTNNTAIVEVEINGEIEVRHLSPDQLRAYFDTSFHAFKRQGMFDDKEEEE